MTTQIPVAIQEDILIESHDLFLINKYNTRYLFKHMGLFSKNDILLCLEKEYCNNLKYSSLARCAIQYASKYGRLEVVKYFHSIGKVFTIDAINCASENGHLEVVNFLQSFP